MTRFLRKYLQENETFSIFADYKSLVLQDIVEQLTQVEGLCQELRRCVMPDVAGVQHALTSSCLLFETSELKIDVSFCRCCWLCFCLVFLYFGDRPVSVLSWSRNITEALK